MAKAPSPHMSALGVGIGLVMTRADVEDKNHCPLIWTLAVGLCG